MQKPELYHNCQVKRFMPTGPDNEISGGGKGMAGKKGSPEVYASRKWYETLHSFTANRMWTSEVKVVLKMSYLERICQSASSHFLLL